MLFVPNIIWAKHQPQGYDQYAKNENKVLLAFERAGEVLVTAIVLIFRDFNVQGFEPGLVWLGVALILMIMYEAFWIRYCKSEMTMKDFYASLMGIPVAGATLPVIVVLLLAIYGRNPLLFVADIILGIGHIGIHLQHRREVYAEDNKLNC